jgi:enhancing lycopene biosynthesis protein 2
VIGDVDVDGFCANKLKSEYVYVHEHINAHSRPRDLFPAATLPTLISGIPIIFLFKSGSEGGVMTKKKVGVLLAGCGVMDGSEIHEATLTLYFLDKCGADYVCMAPNREQLDVIDHATGNPATQKRNVLVEAARIARGKIADVNSVSAGDLDAIIIPGGFGAAKNLCTFAKDGPGCSVDEGVSKLLQELYRQKKPIGALCIAPALLARLFGKEFPVELTIGADQGTASALEKMGAKHQNARVDEIVVDSSHRIVTTPCYMLAQSIKEVGAGVEKLVTKIMEMMNSK